MKTEVDLFYTLHVSIRDSEPLIWRRVEVPGVMPLWELNGFIMSAVLWDGFDLSTFRFKGEEYDPEADTHYWLQDLVGAGECFEWIYSPESDNWVHDVRVESVRSEPDRRWVPVLLDGERACPRDWTGGIQVYNEYVIHWRDTEHPSTQKMLEVLGKPLDPAAFDTEEDLDHLVYFARMGFTMPFRGEMMYLLDPDSVWSEEKMVRLLADPDRWCPVLLASLRRIARDPEKFLKTNEMYFPTIAFYALAGMRAGEAGEIARRLALLEQSIHNELFVPLYEMETGPGWGRLLATLHLDEPKALIPLAMDPSHGEFMREASLSALWTLHLEQKISMEELNGGLDESMIEEMRAGLFKTEGTISNVVEELMDVLGAALEHDLKRFAPIAMGLPPKIWSAPNYKPLVRDAPKVGRNDPCPCGSGKKYKKCCGG